MRTLCIYCCGGLGREIYDLAYSINAIEMRWKSICFIDDIRHNTKINDIDVYSFNSINEAKNKKDLEIVIASGEPSIRAKLHKKLRDYEFILTNLRSNNSFISPFFSLAEGVVIFPNCFIGPNTKIGVNTVFHANSMISHDSSIGDNSMVCPGVNIAGCVTIGNEAFIGIGASIKNSLIIGDNTILGFGSNLANNLENSSIAMSSVAKKIGMNDNRKVF